MEPDPQSQAGFTLIELLIAIAVMGLVIPAIAGAFYVSYQTISGTTDRVNSSAGRGLATAWFGPDVQSARSLSTTETGGCDAPANSDLVVSFQLAENEHITWFRYVPEASDQDDPPVLGRRACTTNDTSTNRIVLERDADPPFCVLPCDGSDDLVTIEFTPKESGVVRLSTARRNPNVAP